VKGQAQGGNAQNVQKCNPSSRAHTPKETSLKGGVQSASGDM